MKSNFYIKIHLLIILLLAIFGSNILKVKILIPYIFLIVEFIFSLIHLLLFFREYIFGKKFKINSYEKKAFRFIAYVLIVVLLSLLGLNKIFNISGIAYNKKYIFNQCYMLIFLPIAFSIYLSFLYNYKYIKTIISKFSKYILILLIILHFFNLCSFTTTTFVYMNLLYFQIKEYPQKKFLNFIFIIYAIYYVLFVNQGTTSSLIFIVILIFLFNKKIFVKISKFRWILYSIIILIIALIINYHNQLLILLKEIDPNSWWRLNYWIDEFSIFKHTYGLGIGYGVTYGSADLFNKLAGGFIDPETGLTVHTLNVLFTTGQHNSYINIIYRTGVIGFILFLDIIIDLIFKYQNQLKNNFDYLLYIAFISSNIIILFNVGLESPQFLFLFYISFGGLLSLKKKNMFLKEREDIL